jgi:hypothetical protein
VSLPPEVGEASREPGGAQGRERSKVDRGGAGATWCTPLPTATSTTSVTATSVITAMRTFTDSAAGNYALSHALR